MTVVRCVLAAVTATGTMLPWSNAFGQTQDSAAATSAPTLTLGFAVDTTVVPTMWWGVDRALAVRPAVVRFWRDYLAIRGDRARRVAFWSMADRRRAPDPDLALASAGYITDARAELIEALPLVAGDSTRWVLRTAYAGTSRRAGLGLLAIERVHVIRDGDRWLLSQPATVETATWRHARVGPIEYVVHPRAGFDQAQAAATARWAEQTAARFRLPAPAPITYYVLPDLEAAFRVLGLDWAVTTDRVGGRANPSARIVLAADPRFGVAYRHELAHVLLDPVVNGSSSFVGEGMAYWLGGARGHPFQEMMRDLASYLDQHPSVGLDTAISSNSSVEFPAAAALFELAHRRGGDTAALRFARALGHAEPTREAIARALDVPATTVEPEWRALVRSYALTRASAPDVGSPR